jgi:hypothetical protein
VIEVPFVLGLIVVPFAFLVLSMPAWIERMSAADTGAAELARAIAIAGETDRSIAVLDIVERGYGLEPGSLRRTATTGLVPGGELRVQVSIDLPVIDVPVLGPIGATTYTATHVERVADHGVVE